MRSVPQATSSNTTEDRPTRLRSRIKATLWGPSAGGIAALVIVPLVLLSYVNQAPYYVTIATMVFIYAIVAVTLNVPIRTGYWPAGQAAFMAAGGYASAIVTTRTGLEPVVGLLLAGLIGGLLAYVVGRLTIRLSGVYFVLGTFAFAEVVRLTIVNNTSFLGGPSGIVGVPGFSFMRGFGQLGDSTSQLLSLYYVALLVLVVAVAVVSFVYRSSVGAIFDAMGENIRLVESQGVNIVQYRVFAFTLSGVFAGFAGALLVAHLQLASPDTFEYMLSIDVLIMNVVGGTRRLSGPLLGALLLTPLPEILRGTGAVYAQVSYGVIVVIVILALPGGLVSLLRRRRRAAG